MTEWLAWFLDTLVATLEETLADIDRTLAKARFWQRFGDARLLPEQIKVLNRLLDGGDRGFEGGISAAQYLKVSKATATRHLADLVERLPRKAAGGCSTRYQDAMPKR